MGFTYVDESATGLSGIIRTASFVLGYKMKSSTARMGMLLSYKRETSGSIFARLEGAVTRASASDKKPHPWIKGWLPLPNKKNNLK